VSAGRCRTRHRPYELNGAAGIVFNGAGGVIFTLAVTSIDTAASPPSTTANPDRLRAAAGETVHHLG
jgi:hypothetical protein